MGRFFALSRAPSRSSFLSIKIGLGSLGGKLKSFLDDGFFSVFLEE